MPPVEPGKLIEQLNSLERDAAELRRQLGAQAPLDVPTLRLIVEHARDCISLHDPSGRFLFASNSFATYFGWQPQDLIGRAVYELFHPDDVARIAVDQAAHGFDQTYRNIAYRLRRTDGSYRWVETRSETCTDDDGVPLVVWVTRDLTELFRSLEELRSQVTALDSLSGRDDLTGLANRRRLRARLGSLLKEGQRRRHFAVALIDVDHFKKINDTFGHVTGDATLIAIANALAQTCRDVDMVGRYGGDEFCAIYVDTQLEQARELAKRQCEAVTRLKLSEARPTISVGVTAYEEGDNIDALLQRADTALYQAKTNGRNQVQTDRATAAL
ncbi:MAG: GGDEF domain-containing protein [Gammaproteobacteria bacterium]|nr:GGDEF domain-containing protein [Gammaproteobacteria bacterium]